MRHVDLVKCVENESDTNACSYLKLPRSHAFVMPNGSINVASALYNLVGNTWEDQDLFFEFGRIYSVRAPTGAGHDSVLEGTLLEDRHDLGLWDFSVVGSGAKYVVAKHRPFGSTAWRVYTSPFTVRFRSSWMHTHSAVASEMFIFQGDVEQMLPSELVKQCYGEHKCSKKGVGGGTGINAKSGDMALTREMSTTLLRDVAKRSFANGQATLRCHYKSRNEWVGEDVYVRSHYRARATADKCEDWILDKGAKISMLALTYPVSHERSDIPPWTAFKQHHRWYAGAQILA